MKWHSISEVAKIVNRSRQAVYKKLKRLSLEEKINLGGNLMEDGQILLSDEGINSVFHLTTSDNQVDQLVVKVVAQVDQPVVKIDEKVDQSIDSEVVTTLQNQLMDKGREVVRLDNMLTNLLTQLDEERRLRGEERQRTDTILMKLTNDISTLQKVLEYKPKETASQVNQSAEKTITLAIVKPVSPVRDKVIEPSQRAVSFWETVRLGLDDCMGLLFGRG